MTLRLNGTSSGFTEIDAPAAAGSNKITLPTSNGSAEQFLKNSGTAGELEFSSMVETSTGVGIGTTSPAFNLDVVSTSFGVRVTNSSETKQIKVGCNDPEVISVGAPLYLTAPSGQPLILRANGDEKARIDSDGNLLIGATSNLTESAELRVSGSGNATAEFYNAGGCYNTWSSGSTPTARGYVGVSNQLVSGGSGTDFAVRAQQNLVIATNGNSERMKISSSGRVSMAHDGSYYDAGETLSVSASDNGDTHVGRNSHASFNNNLIFYYVSRAGNSAFDFLEFRSSNGGDTEYKFRGDGNAYADGSWNGGGADYAEYFEWSDGNTETEDRRGISVVLDGDKIREAVAGEEPIGVISGNPSVVGDADIDRWKGKYLRDDFGTYLQDTHNVVEWDETIRNEDGSERIKKHSYEDWNIPDGIVVPADAVVSATDENGQPYTHRRLNPDYNPDTAYVSREDRPEWDTVGLMGKLRIRKGQVTGTRWIKMRDVSDTVEEWLVR